MLNIYLFILAIYGAFNHDGDHMISISRQDDEENTYNSNDFFHFIN